MYLIPFGAGLRDQINAALPRSQSGPGEIDLVSMVDGKTANLVRTTTEVGQTRYLSKEMEKNN